MSTGRDEPTSSPPRWPLAPDYGDDAFRGTAPYYAEFRERYPLSMLEEIVERAGVSGDGVLLDLGCGTGQVALPMSRWFRQVLASDVEPEMLEVGRQEAARLGIDKVEWIQSRAEDLDFPDGHLDMVTIGNAFHRINRPLVGRRAMAWLPPGRCLVVLGSGKERDVPWRKVLADVVARWTSPTGEEDGGGGPGAQPAATHDEVLADLGFELEQAVRPTPYEWTVDSLVGRMWSASTTSVAVLGDRAAAFEEDLRRSLLAYDPTGRYRETIEYYYILARVPAG